MGHHASRARLAALLDRCRVVDGAGFDLDRFDPAMPPPDGIAKPDAEALLAAGVEFLSGLQERLYAQGTWSLLVVFQAMDAAGKDGTIKHVMTGVNPQGVQVASFKAPGPDDLAHDFLFRVTRALPARGIIGIFNRSHYEEVLVPRVHADVLARERIPAALTQRPDFWDRRIAAIAGFERHLANEGTRVVKLFLNISRAEQKRRFEARLDTPDKLWKFDPGDVAEREHWAAYRDAYTAAIRGTATPDAPWWVIPADRKWLMRLLALEAIVQSLEGLDLAPAEPGPEARTALEAARHRLAQER